MASIDLGELYKKYEGYYSPVTEVDIGGTDIEKQFKKFQIRVVDFNVQVTCEFKASIATFSILNAYEIQDGYFKVEDLKKYVCLGNDVVIYMGHASSLMEVFRGYIAAVNFVYDSDAGSESIIRVTAMDIKGIMMANRYSKRLKANYYSDAVKEILDQQVYQNLTNRGVIKDVSIADTPDKPQGGAGGAGGATGAGGAGGNAPDIRIEMVAESDYDFIVKTAKRFNFEFFTIGGNVAFRKAKLNTQPLAEINPDFAIVSYDIGYDITGVVGQVQVRTLDVGKGTKIESKKKNQSKFSLGSKAKPLISAQSYVYIDSAIESQTEADNRAEYLLEDMSYRLGTLRMTFRGIPDFVPGRFITLKGFGEGISNNFYITDVTHEYMAGSKYYTTIEGKAATL